MRDRLLIGAILGGVVIWGFVFAYLVGPAVAHP